MNQIYKMGYVLGRESALSVAEIHAVLTQRKIDYKIKFSSKEILIISTENEKIQDLTIDDFGGVIKIFKIVDGVKGEANLFEVITSKVKPNQTEKRVNFGISVYSKFNKQEIWGLGQELKSYFLDQGLKARFVTGKSAALSSVIVWENKLIERGFEVILVSDNDKIYIGKTTGSQNYKRYSFRDFNKPRRDDRNGMLPPKLAQIMINLARIAKNESLYDPFCGGGTVLQEAILAGYKSVYGSDIEQKQVDDAKENLKWLEQHFDTKNIKVKKLFLADATIIEPDFTINAIISEGNLGEPIKRNLKRAKDDAGTLAEFYQKVLNNFAKIIEPSGIIVLAVPFFISQNEYTYLPLVDSLSGLGLTLVPPLPPDSKIKLFGRGNLTYRRDNQFVGREILIFKKFSV